MMNTSLNSKQISVSRVAEMANTTTQAVSNWRRRFEDFPRPVAGTARRPLFDFEEIITWLKTNDRYSYAPGFATRMGAFMDGLRAVLPPEESLLAALSAVAWQSLSQKPVPGGFTISRAEAGLPPEICLSQEIEQQEDFQSKLVRLDEWAESTLAYPYGKIFAPLLRALPESGGLFMPTVIPGVVNAPESPDELQDALDEMFNRAGTSDGAGHTPFLIRQIAAAILDIRNGDTVLDPSSGTGSFLLEVSSSSPDTRRVGVESRAQQLQVAALTSIISGFPLELYRGDSMHNDPVPEIVADGVFIDPPLQRVRSVKSLQGDPRWAFGVPASDYDFAWVQHALARLSEDGHAAVVLPVRSLSSSPGQKIRSALIKRGAVEAVITLPKGTYPGTAIPPTLWSLRRPRPETPKRDSVLLVDASGADSSDPEAFQWVANTVLGYRRGESLTVGRPLAAEIPAVDLLSEGANVTPSRWLAESPTIDQQTIDLKISAARSGIHALINASLPAQVSVADTTPPLVKIEDLIKSKSVKIIRANPVPAKDVQDSGSVRYLTPSTLTGSGEHEKYVDDWTLAANPPMTVPGDIAVWGTGAGVRAVALRDGGSVPSTHLQILRVLDGSFDPDYLAACLTSKRNERFLQGSTTVRPRIQDFEVPSLLLAEQRKLSRELRSLSDLQARTARAAEQLAELSGILTDTIGEGTLRLS
ncbi:UNVERIFIED_ORG: hypothetical protein J2X79_003723 [Arthrobacter globiformis]|nr:hypothetical protein [Arthrobacter globiformis]